MVRSRPPPAKTTAHSDISQLSSEVLRLRLQNLNLPITGTRSRLLERLRSASVPPQPRPTSRPARGRVGKKGPRRNSQRRRRVERRPRQDEEQAPASPALADHGSDIDVDSISEAGSSVGDLLDEQLNEQSPGSVFSPAQLAAIQETVSTSVQAAMQSFQTRDVPSCLLVDHSTPNPRFSNVATPVGLNRPLDKSIENKILRGEYVDFCLLLPDTIYQSQTPKLQL